MKIDSGTTTNWFRLGTVKTPTNTILTSGSGTYNTPANVLYLRIRLVGGGGGGGGNASGGNGGDTTFGSLTAGGGNGGTPYNSGAVNDGGAGGAGGTATGGSLNINGNSGTYGLPLSTGVHGGVGGASVFGGSGIGAANGIGDTGASGTTGSGGGGAVDNSGAAATGGGGGSGAYCESIISSPSSTYSYAVGAGGTGSAGTNSGGNGGSGVIIIDEYYGIALSTAPFVSSRTVTSSANILSTDNGQVVFANFSAASTLTLPAPVNGYSVRIKDISGNAQTNNISIAPHSAENIDGLNGNAVISGNYGSVNLMSDGTNWWLI